MRKVILQMMVSFDGYIAGPNGDLDWVIAEHLTDISFNKKGVT